MVNRTFSSFKTIGALPITNEGTKDALIHLTLDQRVIVIDHLNRTSSQSVSMADAIFFRTETQRWLLDLIPAKRPSQCAVELADRLKISTKVLTAEQIVLQPRHQNEQEVWRHRSNSVPVHLRMQILAELGKQRSMPFKDLLIRLDQDPTITSAALYSLACFGLVYLDLSVPLGAATSCSLLRSED